MDRQGHQGRFLLGAPRARRGDERLERHRVARAGERDGRLLPRERHPRGASARRVPSRFAPPCGARASLGARTISASAVRAPSLSTQPASPWTTARSARGSLRAMPSSGKPRVDAARPRRPRRSLEERERLEACASRPPARCRGGARPRRASASVASRRPRRSGGGGSSVPRGPSASPARRRPRSARGARVRPAAHGPRAPSASADRQHADECRPLHGVFSSGTPVGVRAVAGGGRGGWRRRGCRRGRRGCRRGRSRGRVQARAGLRPRAAVLLRIGRRTAGTSGHASSRSRMPSLSASSSGQPSASWMPSRSSGRSGHSSLSSGTPSSSRSCAARRPLHRDHGAERWGRRPPCRARPRRRRAGSVSRSWPSAMRSSMAICSGESGPAPGANGATGPPGSQPCAATSQSCRSPESMRGREDLAVESRRPRPTGCVLPKVTPSVVCDGPRAPRPARRVAELDARGADAHGVLREQVQRRRRPAPSDRKLVRAPVGSVTAAERREPEAGADALAIVGQQRHLADDRRVAERRRRHRPVRRRGSPEAARRRFARSPRARRSRSRRDRPSPTPARDVEPDEVGDGAELLAAPVAVDDRSPARTAPTRRGSTARARASSPARAPGWRRHRATAARCACRSTGASARASPPTVTTPREPRDGHPSHDRRAMSPAPSRRMLSAARKSQGRSRLAYSAASLGADGSSRSSRGRFWRLCQRLMAPLRISPMSVR